MSALFTVELLPVQFLQSKPVAMADYFVITESEKYPHKSWKSTNREVEEIVKEILKQQKLTDSN